MTAEKRSESGPDPRLRLVREAAVFQLKLLVDGLRDFVLVPVSLFAALFGLLRGGDDPQREFEQVLDFGRRSERWINLFGSHDASVGPHDAGSIDGVLERVEQALREQAREGGVTGSARDALHATLESLRGRSAGKADSPPEAGDGTRTQEGQ